MKIKNQSGNKIFWRVFKGDDTVYVIGLAEGTIDGGGTGSWRDDSFSEVKVEIKDGKSVFDKQLVRAGRKFNMTDDLVFDGSNLDIAKINQEGPTTARSATLKDVQFVDTRSFNQKVTREITSALQNALTTTQGLQLSHEHSQTWTAGGKLGGTLGEKDVSQASAEVSAQFQDVVKDFLQKSYTQQVSSVWSKTVKDTFAFDPGFLYAVEVIWSVTLEEGFISYFGEKTSYSVVKTADGSLTRPTKFGSENDMPEDLRTKFNSFK
jgi:hypothetical protein